MHPSSAAKRGRNQADLQQKNGTAPPLKERLAVVRGIREPELCVRQLRRTVFDV